MAPTNGNGVVLPLPSSPPLSARERDQQRAEMVTQLIAVTHEVNVHTQAIRDLRGNTSYLTETQDAMGNELLGYNRFRYKSTWRERLRWIVTGR